MKLHHRGMFFTDTGPSLSPWHSPNHREKSCYLLSLTEMLANTQKDVFHFHHNKKSWSVRHCIGCGCLPFAPFSSQQLMCLGYNVASTYGLIGLLVLRGDYSMRELFKHITLFSSCSSEAKSNQSWTTSAAVSWVTAEVEPRIVRMFHTKFDQTESMQHTTIEEEVWHKVELDKAWKG